MDKGGDKKAKGNKIFGILKFTFHTLYNTPSILKSETYLTNSTKTTSREFSHV